MKEWFRKYPVYCVMAFFTLCVAPVLVMRDFTPANELRYLSVADEAIAQGHVFTFTNQGEIYADKPPLFFWILMLCRLLFGRYSMPVLSLLSLIPAFVTVAVMDRWALRKSSPRTRAAAAMMLLTTALFLGMAVYVRMDMLMCMFIVLALFSFWKERYALFGLFTFLALFTKGPIGLLLPTLAVILYLTVSGRSKELSKAFDWPFWAVLLGLIALWLTGVYLESGRDYLYNLLFHQTFGRAVNAFHHKAPFWFYGVVIWGVAAPWCLLTIPSVVIVLFGRRGPLRDYLFSRQAKTRLFAGTVFLGFILLSVFSSKLAIYLLPLLPFLNYAFVRLVQRSGWRTWMRWSLSLTTLVFAAVGIAIVVGFFLFDRLPIPAEYSFARTPLLILAGLILLSGSIVALTRVRDGWQHPVMILGASLLLGAVVLTPLQPAVNKVTGYGALCEEIQAVAPEGEVFAIGLSRPEGMDVYLHRSVRALDPDKLLRNPSLLPSEAAVVLSRKKDAAASFRYSGILEESGRTCVSESASYTVWR
jgi:4-amino-4-deoxy-L-arabinose transferase-like glycosyltransferase